MNAEGQNLDRCHEGQLIYRRMQNGHGNSPNQGVVSTFTYAGAGAFQGGGDVERHNTNINRFVSAGYKDTCLCFYYGGDLHSWKSDDDPWQEHARHYPNCDHVKEIKGRKKQFIDSIQLAVSLSQGETEEKEIGGHMLDFPDQGIITHELVDQARPQPPQPVLHNPIPEGSNILGSARFEHLNVDADGSPSLLHGVNDIINSIQSGNHGEQHPVQASPSLHAHSPVVPSQGNEVPLHQGNRPQRPAPEREEWQQQETPSGFGVDLRSGRYTSTSDINRDHLNTHGQSASGFSGANMNAQSSRHLTNLPSESINQLQNFHPEVHEICAERMMIPEPANGTLQAQYNSKWWKCYGSFLKAGYDDNTAKHYADQLLSFLDIGEAVKCLHCGERGEMGKQFHHHASCAVSSYQQALERQEWQGQLGPNNTGNNERTVDQRPSAVAAPLASGLSSSSQTASNQAPSTQCLGAVGGVPNSSMYERGSNDGTCTQGNISQQVSDAPVSENIVYPPIQQKPPEQNIRIQCICDLDGVVPRLIIDDLDGIVPSGRNKRLFPIWLDSARWKLHFEEKRLLDERLVHSGVCYNLFEERLLLLGRKLSCGFQKVAGSIFGAIFSFMKF